MLDIVCIGDSLTEGDNGVLGKRGIANVKPLNYPFYLSRLLSANVRNFGKCGYRASTVFERWNDIGISVEDADLILIMLGANGGQKAEGDSADNTAYEAIVDRCRLENPQAKIVLITTPHVTENPSYSNCGYASNVNEAVGFTRRLARERSLMMIDLASFEGFSAATEAVFQSNDGLHFNELGYGLMAVYIARELKRLYPELIKYPD